MNNQAVRQALVNNLLLAYNFAIPQPEEIYLTPYEQESIPAIIGNLTTTSIVDAKPNYKCGRVYSFNVLPYKHPDPIVILCNTGDLRPYYKIWRAVVTKGVWTDQFLNLRTIKKYDEAIKHFIETSSLTANESCFAIIEMLKFKNSNILRSNP